jgi:hypothetical protein
MTLRSAPVVWFFPLALALFPACENKESAPAPEAKKAADAGAPHASGVEKDIVDAVNQVAGGVAAPGMPQSGPPPNGVFPPGAADHELAAGDLPKLSVGSTGSAPTIQFTAPKLDKKFNGKVVMGIQMGPRAAMPTVEIAFAVEPAAATAGDTTTASARTTLNARVTGAKPASDQPGELPPGTDKQIAKIKGSRFRIEVSPTGAGRIAAVEPSKDMDDWLVTVVRAAGDALALAFLPYPSSPVGAGAYWMVTSRESYAGLDVISYRMVKLDKIEGESAALNITTKRYVAGGQLAFQGMPPHHIGEFNGASTASLVVPAGDTEAVHGQSTDTLLAGVTPTNAPEPPPGGQSQHMQVHLEFHSELAMGG